MITQELKDSRTALDAEIVELREGVAGDNPTTDELAAINSKLDELEQLNERIATAERMEKAEAERIARMAAPSVQTGLNKDERKAAEKFNLFAAVKDLAEGRQLTGVAAEMNQEARNEFRGYASNTINVPSRFIEKRTDIDQATSAIAGTAVAPYVDALRENSIYSQVGINMVTGLTGDYKIPVVGKHSLAWASAENSSATDVGANFGKDTLTPYRLTGYVNISNELAIQNAGAQGAVMADLGRATASALDAALFSTATVSNAPTSLAATSGVGTFTEATYTANASIFSDLVEAEMTLADAEGLNGRLAYVGATNLINDLKKSASVASVAPAITQTLSPSQHIVNGYPFHFTVAATSSAGVSGDFIFGDFSRVYMGEWGGLSIFVDPYTNAGDAQIRLVVHKYVDWSLVSGGAFVKATSLVA